MVITHARRGRLPPRPPRSHERRLEGAGQQPHRLNHGEDQQQDQPVAHESGNGLHRVCRSFEERALARTPLFGPVAVATGGSSRRHGRLCPAGAWSQLILFWTWIWIECSSPPPTDGRFPVLLVAAGPLPRRGSNVFRHFGRREPARDARGGQRLVQHSRCASALLRLPLRDDRATAGADRRAHGSVERPCLGQPPRRGLCARSASHSGFQPPLPGSPLRPPRWPAPPPAQDVSRAAGSSASSEELRDLRAAFSSKFSDLGSLSATVAELSSEVRLHSLRPASGRPMSHPTCGPRLGQVTLKADAAYVNECLLTKANKTDASVSVASQAVERRLEQIQSVR